MGRTVFKFSRLYVDGVDISGYARGFGELLWNFDEVDCTAPLGDAVKGALPGTCVTGVGTLNAVLDPTATGPIQFATGSNSPRCVMIAIGKRAAPVMGDPIYTGYYAQLGVSAANDGGLVTLSMPMGNVHIANETTISKPWGALAYPKTDITEPDVNTANGFDGNLGSSSHTGCKMVYMLFASNGTINLKIQHCTTINGIYADISPSLETGNITAAVAPKFGIVATSRTQSVSRYIRAQWVWGDATTATMAIGFVRNTIPN